MMNTYAFTRYPSDMPGVDASVICHHLNVDLTCRHIKHMKKNVMVNKQLAAVTAKA